MSVFINDALAATSSAPAAQPDSSFSLMMIVIVFLLSYFMLIRPQSKRAKEQKNLIDSVKKSDEIVTSGGLLGKVTHIDEQYMKVCVAENVELTLQRTAVVAVLPKGTIQSL